MLNGALLEFAKMLGWSLVAALCLGVGLGLTVKIFDLTTPGLDEVEELKKGNIAVAIVLAAVIISVGFVIGMAIL